MAGRDTTRVRNNQRRPALETPPYRRKTTTAVGVARDGYTAPTQRRVLQKPTFLCASSADRSSTACTRISSSGCASKRSKTARPSPPNKGARICENCATKNVTNDRKGTHGDASNCDGSRGGGGHDFAFVRIDQQQLTHHEHQQNAEGSMPDKIGRFKPFCVTPCPVDIQHVETRRHVML